MTNWRFWRKKSEIDSSDHPPGPMESRNDALESHFDSPECHFDTGESNGDALKH